MTEALRAQAELLRKQCLKHQVFKETMLEAQKMAKGAAIFLELAAAANDDETDQKQADLKKAAELLSRAKRHARKLMKAPEKDEDDDE